MARGGLVRFSVVRGSQLLISCLRDLGLQSSFLEGKMPACLGRLKKEQEEKEQKRKEKAEAHLYTIIKVARDEDLLEQIGRDIYILILWIMTKFEVFVFRNKWLSTFSSSGRYSSKKYHQANINSCNWSI
ncbi:unnamed protein product [Camellia sinensis]